jgi:hypothetical protein
LKDVINLCIQAKRSSAVKPCFDERNDFGVTFKEAILDFVVMSNIVINDCEFESPPVNGEG